MSTGSLDLEALKELCEKATPGPWGVRHRHSGCSIADDERSGLSLELEGPEYPDLRGQFALSADARLAAASRSAVPALIAEVERLRTQRDEALAALAEAADQEFRKDYENRVIHAQRILAAVDKEDHQ